MNYCPGSCTKRWLQTHDGGDGGGGFQIMYAHIHMHGLGRGGELQLIRNASASAERWERTRLLHRRHWDFENQQGHDGICRLREASCLCFEHHLVSPHALDVHPTPPTTGVTFSPLVPLHPGDSFLTCCHYDSSWKNATTIYGQSADDEMCLGLVFVRGLNTSVVCLDLEGTFRGTGNWIVDGLFRN